MSRKNSRKRLTRRRNRQHPGGFLGLYGKNFHHVPPRHPDRHPHFKGMKKSKKAHAAYHLLFHAAATYEMAVEILRRDWWPNGKKVACAEAPVPDNPVPVSPLHDSRLSDEDWAFVAELRRQLRR